MSDQLTAVTEGEASGNNDELITTFRDCSKERISSKQFDRKSNLGTIGATIIEGEASETDEELEVPTKTISVMPLDCELKVLENPRRTHTHVDEKLEQCWRNLGGDTLTVSWKRNQPALTNTREMEKLIDQTFTTTQSASSYIRRAASIICHLEDSVSSLIEGAKLIPDSFTNNE